LAIGENKKSIGGKKGLTAVTPFARTLIKRIQNQGGTNEKPEKVTGGGVCAPYIEKEKGRRGGVSARKEGKGGKGMVNWFWGAANIVKGGHRSRNLLTPERSQGAPKWLRPVSGTAGVKEEKLLRRNSLMES